MTKDSKPIKVMIAKIGLDGHDRGAKVVALGLRNEGMEVIYTGLRQTAQTLVQAALQEDVDVIGLSSLSGAHKYHFPDLTKALKERGMERILVIGGGMIPPEDIPFLKENGIAEVFVGGTTIETIADFIRRHVREGSQTNSKHSDSNRI